MIYLVWGSTYLANYWAIDSIPPFINTASRFLAAGTLLYSLDYCFGKKEATPNLKAWKNALILGILFMALGVGAVVWSEQFIDTNVVALIISAEPLLVLLMVWAIHKTRPKLLSFFGVFVGILGTILLIGQPQIEKTPETYFAVAMVFLAITGWGLATVLVSQMHLAESKLRSSAMQMLCGGLVLIPFSYFVEDWSAFSVSDITQKSLFSWLYLVFFGGIIAFSCFNYLLSKVSPEKVATSTYVHPVVAMFLGWSLNGEIITLYSISAGVLLLTGVYFINKS